MSRLFGTSNDQIALAPGALVSSIVGAVTMAFLWRPASLHAGGLLVALNSGGFGVVGANPFSDGKVYFTPGLRTITYTAGGWLLTAYTRPAGFEQTARGHQYDYGTGTWSHSDLGTANDATNGPVASVRVGNQSPPGEFLRGELTAIGVWNTVLADAALEGITTSLRAWLDLSPAALWAFNQASTSDPVLDLTGNGADQTSVTGTTVDADEPPGWSYSLTVDDAVGAGPRIVTGSACGRFGTSSRARYNTTTGRGRL